MRDIILEVTAEFDRLREEQTYLNNLYRTGDITLNEIRNINSFISEEIDQLCMKYFGRNFREYEDVSQFDILDIIEYFLKATNSIIILRNDGYKNLRGNSFPPGTLKEKFDTRTTRES